MRNIDLTKKHEEYIISQRRYFHENPELTRFEFETVKKISEELNCMGMPHVEIENGGILATIKGTREGSKTVLLRADMDALAINESENNLKLKRTCVSKNAGVMHACGHDGHVAMLLGTAKILLEKIDEIEGTVLLCFERAEEGGGGYRYILQYIDDNKINIDSVYSMHLYAKLESGKLAINDGPVMACNMPFHITIKGKSGHGSRPDLSVNPIDAFVDIYTRLNSLRLTKIDPFKVLTWSIGEVTAGNSQNVIPDSLMFKGTVRTFDRDGAGMIFHRELKNIVDSACEFHGCQAVYTRYGVPGLAIINDKECTEFAKKVIGEELGTDNIVSVEPWMASEPFSRYLCMWPGVFALLGIKNEEKGIGAEHHNELFDIDEDVLHMGAASSAIYAIEFLKSGMDTSSRKLKGGYGELVEILKGKKKEI